MKGRYLFLYLNTGGGHLAPARSLRDHLRKAYPYVGEPILRDGFTEAPRYLRFFIEDAYRWMQSSARWLYASIYALNKIPIARKTSASVVARVIEKDLEDYILRERPSKIAVFHFLLIKPVLDILSRYQLRIPTVVVVTDPFTAHPIWFQNEGVHYILFSERLQEYCRGLGIPDHRMEVFPFVLDSKFTRPQSTEELWSVKERLSLDPSKKVILILGGGDGMPRGMQILKQLARLSHLAQVVIICGRSMKLYRRACAFRDYLESENVKVFGFVDTVHQFLKVADVVVTKCGASTFMEILCCGKIPVVNRYLWEQERGNVDFLLSRTIGIYEHRVRNLTRSVERLLTDEETSRAMTQNILSARVENGIGAVSNFLLQFEG
ncbi:MAG TPA: glycosyltransferase [Bacteroidota bacterium]|nr:glycosyltransferase [Bacteroidota bacterium]